MALANTPATGQATSYWYCIQDTDGALPASPVFKRFRFTGGVPSVTRDTLESGELDGTSELTSVRLGSFNVAAESQVELIAGAHDDLLAAAMQSTWTAGATVSGLSVTVDATAKTFTRASGSFVTDGVVVGDIIRFPALSGYNSYPMVVTAVSALVVTCAMARTKNDLLGVEGLTNQSTITTSLVRNSTLKVGVSRKKIAFLTVYNDLVVGTPKYDLVMDGEITGFKFTTAVNAMVTGSFNVIGKGFSHNWTLAAGATFSDTNTLEPFSGIDGGVSYAGATIGFVSSMETTLDRGANAVFELGSKYCSHVSYTKAKSTITASTLLYEDNPFMDAFFDETEASLQVMCSNATKAFALHYPRVTCTSSAPDVKEGDIAISAEFTASKDSTAGTSLIIRSI